MIFTNYGQGYRLPFLVYIQVSTSGAVVVQKPKYTMDVEDLVDKPMHICWT